MMIAQTRMTGVREAPKKKKCSMDPRRTPPGQDETTDRSESLCFRVWSRDPAYLEDELPWKCVGAFRFLLECLDYIAYCQDAGADVVFQSPADVHWIKPSDRRVVAIPDGCELMRPRVPRSGFSVDGGNGQRLIAEGGAA